MKCIARCKSNPFKQVHLLLMVQINYNKHSSDSDIKQ